MMFYERKGGNKVDTHLEELLALPKIDAKLQWENNIIHWKISLS